MIIQIWIHRCDTPNGEKKYLLPDFRFTLAFAQKTFAMSIAKISLFTSRCKEIFYKSNSAH